MDNVRLRRLKADYEALRRLAHLHPKIEIEGVAGNPPDRYRIKLKVKSLRERGETLETIDEHRLEVTMPRGYPRDAPLFRMLTPVFHPNIAPHAVCIGDDWTAGESLDLLIQRVGEILAYQSYNTKSPLNGRAAQWVDEHRDRVPIDREEFFVDLSAVPSSPAPATGVCSNCSSTGSLTPCSANHQLCADCVMRCGTCSRVICLSCGDRTCPSCAPKLACSNCSSTSSGLTPCSASQHQLCADCVMQCGTCSRIVCLSCGERSCTACAQAVI